MPEPKPTIVIRDSDGNSFEFVPPDALWIDMQAFAAASGLTYEEMIQLAVDDFVTREFPDV